MTQFESGGYTVTTNNRKRSLFINVRKTAEGFSHDIVIPYRLIDDVELIIEEALRREGL